MRLLVLLLVTAGWGGDAQAAQRGYTLDPHESEVIVLVRRLGLFSWFSDDHVLLAEGIAGRVHLDPDVPAQAALQLSLPVQSLRVDPAEVRQSLGLDDGVDDGDREDIRAVLLSPEMLDADLFPRVIVTLESTGGVLPDLLLGVRVRIRQIEQVLAVPVRLVLEGDALIATGEVDLLQSQFGITPHSALLGMLAVEDRVTIRFRVVARMDEL